MASWAGSQIYTYIGPVLVAVNPYKKITELYSDAAMETYHGAVRVIFWCCCFF